MSVAGSKAEKLRLSKCLLLFPQQRTFIKATAANSTRIDAARNKPPHPKRIDWLIALSSGGLFGLNSNFLRVNEAPMAMLKPSAGRLRAAPTRLRERNPVLSKDKTRIWLARIIKPLADAPYRHRERVFNPDRKESRGRCPARRKPAYLTAGTGAAARPKSCMSRIPDRKNGTACSRWGR
jgi:hypothetical protein